MTGSDSVRARVEQELHLLLGDQRHRWQAVSPLMSTVFDELDTMVLAGGKRLRPQFLHWGWVAAGGDPNDEVHHAFGAAIELLHAFALFHDDVIDDAGSRRGHETTHRRLSRFHEEDALAGESRRFGEGSAVLIGDIAYALADVLMTGLPPAARPFWNDLRLEMNVGQYLDTVGSALREPGLEHSQLVARLKTAKYTIERPLHVGAMAADAATGTELLQPLSGYGIPLGIAFQLRDDILGAFGDESVTGKPVGGDFREGKSTALVAFARESADPRHLRALESLGDPGISTGDISAIQSAIVESGALEKAENMVVSLRNDALAALSGVALRGDARDQLVLLADSVTTRNV